MDRDDCPRLLSLAVHEFRTPVTVVAGYLRMLLKMQAGVGDQPRKLIEEAEKSCARLAALIAELGELSNFESQQIRLDWQDLDLFGLFAELAANVQEGADRDVRVELTQPAERVVVSGDRKYLARALETLLTATLRERAQPGVILGSAGVRPTANGPVAYIAMAPRDHAAAPQFDPSQWAPFEPWRGGLGFRVVLAQQVIAAHGGTLFSGRDTHARAACAVTLPVKES